MDVRAMRSTLATLVVATQCGLLPADPASAVSARGDARPLATEDVDAAALIPRALARYQLERPLVVEGRSTQCWAILPARELGLAREFLTHDTHPESKPDSFFVESFRLVLDGTGRARRDTRNLAAGGPPQRATRVRILDGTATVESPQIGADQALRADRRMPEVASHEPGSAWSDQMIGGAFNSFPHECRWALQHIAPHAGTIEVRRIDDRRLRLFSAAAGVRVTIDLRLAEVDAVEKAGPRGGVDAVWASGFHPEQVLPARLPRAVHRRAAAPETDEPLSADSPALTGSAGGARDVIDRVTRPESVDRAQFAWQRVARRLHDYDQNAILDAGEQVDEARTAVLRRGPVEPIRLTEGEPDAGRVSPARKPRETWRTVGIAGGAACVALAAVMWWRRRRGS